MKNRFNLWKKLQNFLRWFRRIDANHGYTCDFCGREIFDYPTHRICEDCEKTFQKRSSKTCGKCGRLTRSEGICLTCKNSLPTFTRGFSPFCYGDNVSMLVNRFKNGKRRLGLYLGEKMAEVFYHSLEPNATRSLATFLIVAVPLTREKQNARGYNQAEVLSETIAQTLEKYGLSAQTDFDVLHKVKDTHFQKNLDFQSRKENVEGAYHVHKRSVCKGKTIILVDDIMTTGATGNECARKLLNAGADKVYFLTGASLPEMSIT